MSYYDSLEQQDFADRDYVERGYLQRDDAGNGIWGTISRNPEGILLMLAGAALLLRSGRASASRGAYGRGDYESYQTYSDFERTGTLGRAPGVGQYETDRGQGYAESARERAAEYGEAARERAAEYGEAARQRAAEMGEGVSRAAHAAGEYVSGATERMAGAARSTADTMSQYADSARHRAAAAQSSMQESFDTLMREQPLAIAAIGFVAGAAVAAVLPATEAEEQALGPARDAIAEAAYAAGENLREAANEAGETLRTRAAERGLSPEGLKDLAGEVAGAFTNAVAGKEEHGSPSVVPENVEPMTGGNR